MKCDKEDILKHCKAHLHEGKPIPQDVLEFMMKASFKEIDRLWKLDVFFQSDILPSNPTLDQEL